MAARTGVQSPPISSDGHVFFCEHRPPSDTAYFSSAELQHDFQQFLHDIGAPTLTWHSLRRGGAHALVQLGIAPDRLMHWGRWRSYNAARIYFEIDHYQPAIPATICVFNPDGSTSTMSPAELWPRSLLPSFTPLSSDCYSTACPTTHMVSFAIPPPVVRSTSSSSACITGLAAGDGNLSASSDSSRSSGGHNFNHPSPSPSANTAEHSQRGRSLRKRRRSDRNLA